MRPQGNGFSARHTSTRKIFPSSTRSNELDQHASAVCRGGAEWPSPPESTQVSRVRHRLAPELAPCTVDPTMAETPRCFSPTAMPSWL